MDGSRIRNDENLGRVPLDRRYLHVNLDVVERCNLDCVHCPYVWLRETIDDKATMPREMVGRLEREVFPFAVRASLSSFHESLMAPERLFEVMAAAQRAGVPNIDMHTNGLLLTEVFARKLLSGMNLIMLSLEGASPESYAAQRKGGTLERFKDRVAMLVRLRKDMGLTEKVKLRFTACMSQRNIQEAKDLVELSSELGVDWLEMRFAKIADVAELGEGEQLCHNPLEADSHFRAAKERAQVLGLRLDLPPSLAEIQASDRPRPRYTNCLYPWTTIQLTPRGGVVPCCLWHGSDVVDNWDERPFDEVWNGEGFRRLRHELETSSLSRPACQNCEVHFNLADPRFWQNFEFVKA